MSFVSLSLDTSLRAAQIISDSAGALQHWSEDRFFRTVATSDVPHLKLWNELLKREKFCSPEVGKDETFSSYTPVSFIFNLFFKY